MNTNYTTIFIFIFYFCVNFENSDGYKSGHYNRYSTKSSQNNKQCDDIAIIGAGIAGTYAAWRLRNQNKQINLYEFSNRVGGRLYTYKFPGIPDINVELGGMRFLPDQHRLIYRTIRELGLQAVDFELGSGPSLNTLVYVRGTHLRHGELGGHKTPYNLHPFERKHVDQLRWEVYRNNTDVLINNLQENDKRFFTKSSDGLEMFKQSTQAFYHKAASIEVQNYIRETSAFQDEKTVSSVSMDLVLSPPSDSRTVVQTVATGMNSVPEVLLKEFLRVNDRLTLNHNIKAIKRKKNGMYVLIFDATRTDNGRTRIVQNEPDIKRCARRVILATNRHSLERLDWDGLYQPKIREYLTKAVLDLPTAKLFFAYPNPWWRRSPVYADFAISDTPLRQTYDFGNSSINPSNSVLQPMYVDDGVSYWEELANRGNCTYREGDVVLPAGEEIIGTTNRYLSKIYNIPIRSIPKPRYSVMSLWKSYPYGGGWQIWLPGYLWPVVERQMVKPSRVDDIFIVCNAFNARSLSYWSEGALESVELAMPYFGLKRRK